MSVGIEALISFEEMKSFVVNHYKHERLYGRNESNGWTEGYGNNIVNHYLYGLKNGNTKLYVSRHESKTGQLLCFSIPELFEFVASEKDTNSLIDECVSIELMIESPLDECDIFLASAKLTVLSRELEKRGLNTPDVDIKVWEC